MGKGVDKFVENHKADLQQLGFDVQFECFVYYLLKIDDLDGIVAYESFDDIVVMGSDGISKLIQVKYSTNYKSITNYDEDFTKTISNWIDLYNNQNKKEQDSFFDKHRFVLLTNRTMKSNLWDMVISAKHMLKDSSVIWEYLIKEYQSLNAKGKTVGKDKKTPSTLFLEKLIAFGKSNIALLFANMEIVERFDVKVKLLELWHTMYGESENTYRSFKTMLGDLLQEKMECANNKVKFKKTGKQKGFLIQQYIHELNISALTIEKEDKDYSEITDDFNDYEFVRQLRSIGAISSKDKNDEDFIEYWNTFFSFKNAVKRQIKEQLLTKTRLEELEEDVYTRWKGELKKQKRELTKGTEDIEDLGYDCFHEIYMKNITYNGNFLNLGYSQGCTLNLSDGNPPRIYWRSDWLDIREKYDE